MVRRGGREWANGRGGGEQTHSKERMEFKTEKTVMKPMHMHAHIYTLHLSV